MHRDRMANPRSANVRLQSKCIGKNDGEAIEWPPMDMHRSSYFVLCFSTSFSSSFALAFLLTIYMQFFLQFSLSHFI